MHFDEEAIPERDPSYQPISEHDASSPTCLPLSGEDMVVWRWMLTLRPGLATVHGEESDET